MSNVAIMILMMMIIFTVFVVNRVSSQYGPGMAIKSAIVMSINILLVIFGNPWVWAGWTLFRTMQNVFFPGKVSQEARDSSSYGLFMFTTMFAVCFSAATFVLFQNVR
jgi:hypothetical protein